MHPTSKKGLQENSVRMVLDGTRIQPGDTAESLAEGHGWGRDNRGVQCTGGGKGGGGIVGLNITYYVVHYFVTTTAPLFTKQNFRVILSRSREHGLAAY